MNRIVAIAEKEFLEIWRNRLFLALSFLVPFVMFVVFAYGISLDIENIPMSYIDQDNTLESRELINRFTLRYFRLQAPLRDIKEAEALLQRGALRAVVVVPPGFTRELYSGRKPSVQVLIDGGFPYTALTVKGYAEAISRAYSLELQRDWMAKKGMPLPPMPLKVEFRYLFNESLKSSFSLVPALIAIVLLVNPSVLTAISIAREKEFGTIYNIYSTPIRKIEFLAGKLIPYGIISMINFFVILLTIKVLFHIPMKGSLLDLLPAAVVYVLINVSIGLVISSLTHTVVSAQIITLIITTIPAFLYSGLLIPVANLGTEGRVMAH
ncbi:MAG: ABC transporter permease, partial [Nitrospirae bacterium]